jgi:hypothetical protein
MSEVAITNNMGRSYSIPVKDGLIFNNINLKAGLNLIAGAVWDEIKKHPAVKALTETNQEKIFERLSLNERDKIFHTRGTSIGKKKLEVNDYRKSKKD